MLRDKTGILFFRYFNSINKIDMFFDLLIERWFLPFKLNRLAFKEHFEQSFQSKRFWNQLNHNYLNCFEYTKNYTE